MTAPPFDIAIPAHIDVSTVAGRTVNVPLFVSNIGQRALRVHATILGGPHGWHMVLARTMLRIRPGRKVLDSLRFIVPRHAGGLHNLHVEFAAAPLSHAPGVAVSGGVSNTIAVRLPALVVPVSHSFPLLLVGGVGLFVVLVAVAVVASIFRRRNARLARSRAFVTELHDEEVAAR